MHHPTAFVSLSSVGFNSAAAYDGSAMSSTCSTSSVHGARVSTFLGCQMSARHSQFDATSAGVRRVAHMPAAMSVTSPSPSPSPSPTDRGGTVSGNSPTPLRQHETRQPQQEHIATGNTSSEDISDKGLIPNKLNRAEHTVARTAIRAAMSSQAELPNAVYIPVEIHSPSATSIEDDLTTDKLPECLYGLRLLRMGPGIFDGLTHSDGQPFEVGHWFDGLCLLHDFTFLPQSSSSSSARPTLRYRSRSLAKHVERTIEATPRWRWLEMSFGSPPLLLTPRGGSNGGERSWLRKMSDAVLASVLPVIDPVTNSPLMPNIPILLQHVGSKGMSARTDGSISIQVLLNDEYDDAGTTGTSSDDDSSTMRENGDGTIEPGEFFTFTDVDRRLKGFFAASHAGIDDTTGDMYDFVFDLDDLDKRGEVQYTVFHLPVVPSTTPSSKTSSSTTIPTGDEKHQGQGPARILASFKAPPVYMHSVGLTPTYVILTLWPMVLRPLRFLVERAMTRSMMFDRRLDTEFRIVHRDTGELAARVIADAAFVFHIANAFDVTDGSNEDRESAVGLDVCWFPDGNAIVNAMSMRSMRNATTKNDFPAGKLMRYTLPVRPVMDDAGGRYVVRASTKTLYNGYVELPCVAPRAVNDPAYRFVYGVAHEDAVFDSVVKIDVSRGAVVGRWSCGDDEDNADDEISDGDVGTKNGDHGVVGEPVFVPNVGVAATEEEDDGVLLVVTVQLATEEADNNRNENEKEWKSRLVVLCAKDMRMMASAVIPRVVPLGYHGYVVKKSQ